MIRWHQYVALSLLALPLAGCGLFDFGSSGSSSNANDTPAVEGDSGTVALPALTKPIREIGGTAQIGPAQARTTWPQSGGSADHSLGHAALSADPNLVWRNQVSTRMRRGRLATTEPLILGNFAFVLSWDLRVSALNLTDGSLMWRADLHPANDSGGIFGGGMAAHGNVIYVTTGAGEIHALRQSNGERVWTKPLAAPSHAGPLVYNGRLYVNDVNGNITAFSFNGAELWTKSSQQSLTSVLGAGTPAGGSNGVFDLSADGILRAYLPSGGLAWQADTAVSGPAGRVSDVISDTRALPIVQGEMVLVSGWSNRTLAYDISSGTLLWEFPLGGAATPAVTNAHVFMVTKDGDLRALRRSDGAQIWSLDLGREEVSRHVPTIGWQGPVLAGGNLIVGSSEGLLRFIDPVTGTNRHILDVRAPIVTPLTVASNTLLVTTSNGEILAFR